MILLMKLQCSLNPPLVYKILSKYVWVDLGSAFVSRIAKIDPDIAKISVARKFRRLCNLNHPRVHIQASVRPFCLRPEVFEVSAMIGAASGTSGGSPHKLRFRTFAY